MSDREEIMHTAKTSRQKWVEKRLDELEGALAVDSLTGWRRSVAEEEHKSLYQELLRLRGLVVAQYMPTAGMRYL